MISKAGLVILSAGALPSALAWGAAGHQIVATVAQVFLTPNSRAALCEILPDFAKCHLAPIAAWADTIRNPYTGPLHYINGNDDWPADHCAFGEHGWKDPKRNVLVGILNSTRGVRTLEGHDQDFALRYLVHFMGDLHMPLHLTGRDRGGNEDRVRFDRRITNLHSVWDGRLLTNALRTLTNYTTPLPSRRIESALQGAIYDSYVRFIVWEGVLGWWKSEWLSWSSCPPSSSPFDGLLDDDDDGSHIHYEPTHDHQQIPLALSSPPPSTTRRETLAELPVCPLHWARPIHALNCNGTLIWPRFLSEVPPHNSPTPPTPAPELIELDTPAYAGRVRKELVIEKLLAMAGVRLAAVLNELLDPEGPGAHENVNWNT